MTHRQSDGASDYQNQNEWTFELCKNQRKNRCFFSSGKIFFPCFLISVGIFLDDNPLSLSVFNSLKI
jgi:hypothetical protein